MPRNPGRRDLGMRATLLFPNREIVERYYVPLGMFWFFRMRFTPTLFIMGLIKVSPRFPEC